MRDTSRQGLVLAAAVLTGIVACVIAAPLTRADPLLLMELVSGAVATVWAGIATVNLLRGWSLGRGLHGVSDERSIDGIRVHVVAGGGRMAMAVGTVMPRIFIGDGLLRILSRSERAAVLMHEEHHRLSRAPIRAASLEAWLTLLRWCGPARRRLMDRLSDLEQLADEYATARGSRPASIARALLKTDAAYSGTAFSYMAERRISALVETERGQSPRARRLPYEWLPLAAVTVMSVACHLWGLPS